MTSIRAAQIPCAAPGCTVTFRPNWRQTVTCSGRCMEVLRNSQGLTVGGRLKTTMVGK